jgi:flagellar motor switch protein FliN/FliY
MAAAAQPVAPPHSQQGQPVQTAATVKGSALVPSPSGQREQPCIGADSTVARLPVELEVGLPVRDFRVCNLLALERGVVVASQWNHGEDLPLAAGAVQLAWIQFEVVDNALAARITRLA